MENLDMNFFNLIKELLQEEYEELSTINNLTNLDFLIVKNDVFGINGPVAIQVEYFTVNDQIFKFTLEKQVEKKVKYVAKELEKEPIIKNAIIITNLDNTFIKNFQAENNSLLSNNMYIWGAFDINGLIEKHHDISANYKQEFFVTMLLEEFSKFVMGSESRTEQIDFNNKKYLSEMKKAYREDELALFLGAGLSMSANLPSWKELVSKVYFEALQSKGINIKDITRQPQAYWQLTENLGNNNLLIRTKYAKLLLDNDFIPIIHKWLYIHPTKTSELIQTVAKLICGENDSVNAITNVVTYNYDNLLEMHLEDCRKPYTSIWKDSQRTSPASTAIYHVHGYLPLDNEFSENVVFSEDEYHDQYKNPYSWSNVIQLNLLREKRCVFIGSTLSDPNTRRLLDVSKKKNNPKQHFVFYQRLYNSKRITEITESADILNKLKIHSSYEKVVESLRYLMMDEDVIKETMLAEELLIEKDFNDLGVNVIWFNDFSEIPVLIKSIKEA